MPLRSDINPRAGVHLGHTSQEAFLSNFAEDDPRLPQMRNQIELANQDTRAQSIVSF